MQLITKYVERDRTRSISFSVVYSGMYIFAFGLVKLVGRWVGRQAVHIIGIYSGGVQQTQFPFLSFKCNTLVMLSDILGGGKMLQRGRTSLSYIIRIIYSLGGHWNASSLFYAGGRLSELFTVSFAMRCDLGVWGGVLVWPQHFLM